MPVALPFRSEEPLDHLDLRSLFLDVGIGSAIDSEFCTDIELFRSSIALPFGVELGVSRSGTLQAFKDEGRRRAQIAKRLHSEMRSDVPTSVERRVGAIEGFGVSGNRDTCSPAWLKIPSHYAITRPASRPPRTVTSLLDVA
jgi:hypothetical protein